MCEENHPNPFNELSTVSMCLKSIIESHRIAGSKCFLEGDLDGVQENLEKVLSLHRLEGIVSDAQLEAERLGLVSHQVALPVISDALIEPDSCLVQEVDSENVDPSLQDLALPSANNVSGDVLKAEAQVRLTSDLDERTELAVSPPVVSRKAQTPKIRAISAKEFYDLARRLTDIPTSQMTQEDLAQLKRAVCMGRALRATESTSHRDAVDDELHHLKEHFNAATNDEPFFGFSPKRSHTPEVWCELAAAYDYLSVAQVVTDCLLTTSIKSSAEKSRLLSGAAACETLLHRIIDERALSVVDGQQIKINRELRALAEDLGFVRWWKGRESDGPSIEDILEEAKRVRPLLESAIQNALKLGQAKDALNTLAGVIEMVSDDPSIILDSIVEATVSCLEVGIPGSNKDLGRLLQPYHKLLEAREDDRLKPIVNVLKKNALLMMAKKQEVVEVDLAPDGVNEAKLEEVKSVLSGKSVLFLGGRKGQTQRHKEIQEILNLSNLTWPDLEEDSRRKEVVHLIRKADAVCMLVRWSRHYYKEHLDDAKAQGKIALIIPRGLGVNTIVNDIHGQLFPSVSNSRP